MEETIDVMDLMRDIQGRCQSDHEAALRVSARYIIKKSDKESLNALMLSMAFSIAHAAMRGDIDLATKGLAIMLDEMRLRSYVD